MCLSLHTYENRERLCNRFLQWNCPSEAKVFVFVPVIANKPKSLPYIEALLLREEEHEKVEEEENVRIEPVVEPAPSKATETKPATAATPGGQNEQQNGKQVSGETPGGSTTEVTDSDGQIDNPYLRPIIMPRLKAGNKKLKW